MNARPSRTDVTRLLERVSGGDRAAVAALVDAVYGELRNLAGSHLGRERRGHTLSATALVHEAWLRLADQRQPWQGRAHFFGAASHAMRRILIDYARAKTAGKRKGERVSLTAVEDELTSTPSFEELLTIDTALENLAQVNDRLVRVVECRYFGGLTIPETADALGVSHTTVSEDWRFARAWLQRALGDAQARAPHPPDL
ncbi:MAG TPA: ECF-type sigma factor [Vicinamibacterales bacterium]|nr:ECF-type sigma factor [Vicinamibacterales bacterium]